MKMAHEITTKFRAIRSGTTSKRSLDSAGAVSRAGANLRYILRESAAADVVWSGEPLVAAAKEAGSNRQARRRAIRLAFHPALKEAAERGGKNGARVMDTAIITFPASWPNDACKEGLRRVCALYAPPDSDAVALGVLHKNTPGNKHGHIAATNGYESHEAAAARAALTGKRPRRRLVNRMAEIGSPKKMRAAIAAQLNAIAAERGLETVEHRTLKSRGIEREGKHLSQAAYRAKKNAIEDVLTPAPTLAPEAPQEAPEVAPMPHAPTPAPEAPKTRKMKVGGRWITVPVKAPTPAPSIEDLAAIFTSEEAPTTDIADKQKEAWETHPKPVKETPPRRPKRNTSGDDGR
jgi:hypothetical protein